MKIRCDKNMEYLTQIFTRAAGIPAEIAEEGPCDVCLLLHVQPKLIHNLPAGCIIIANADDFSVLRTLEGMGNTIITCGLSGTATITVSSISDNRFVLCLQRKIKTWDGKVVQPQEIPVSVSGISADINQMLLLLSLKLLGGAKEEEKIILSGRR